MDSVLFVLPFGDLYLKIPSLDIEIGNFIQHIAMSTLIIAKSKVLRNPNSKCYIYRYAFLTFYFSNLIAFTGMFTWFTNVQLRKSDIAVH